MFRIMWRFPLYGNAAEGAAPPPPPDESWCWPATAYEPRTNELHNDPVDMVEVGHKLRSRP